MIISKLLLYFYCIKDKIPVCNYIHRPELWKLFYYKQAFTCIYYNSATNVCSIECKIVSRDIWEGMSIIPGLHWTGLE